MAASDLHARRISRMLVARGRREFEASRRVPQFTPDRAANALMADLRGFPHAFVIGCLMDRQIKAERAWEIPYRIQERLGSFEFRELRRLSQAKVIRLMRRPTPLHRYPETMGTNLHAALALIADRYDGDAGRIWKGRPGARTAVGE
ncbi:MAG: hypothetical protein KAX37_07800, partial [Opitutaceae bacterium]|nr:hypothetical protein [Opitutaceae bacterium]